MNKRKFFAPLVAALVILTPLTAVLAATVNVTPLNTNGWQTQSSGTASVTFVTGPGTPPLGIGSAQLAVGADGGSAAQLRNPNYAGTLLSDITALSYSTYAQSGGSGGQTPYIILNIDNDNNGSVDDQLFFEPVYQNGTYSTVDPSVTIPNQCGTNPGCVTQGVWQTWDAQNGGWWALSAATFGPPLTTLAFYQQGHPNARIVNSGTLGGVRIVAGFGAGAWDNFIGNVDSFRIAVNAGSDTTFNFEPGVANLVWTTTGSTGTVDEEDLSIVELNNFVVGVKNPSPNPVNIRYNINAASVPASGTTGTQKVSVVVRFRDSDGAGADARVFFTIRRTNILTGGNEVLLTFDSNTQPPAGVAFQTQTVTDCSAPFDFDSTQYVYWIEGEVTRKNTSLLANLGAVQIVESNDTCP
jgi:hypothetical protein